MVVWEKGGGRGVVVISDEIKERGGGRESTGRDVVVDMAVMLME